MSKPDTLPSIDLDDLASVTGGTHKPGHNDAQLTAALATVTDSLKSLQANNNNGGISQLLPFLMLAKGGGGCPGGNCGR